MNLNEKSEYFSEIFEGIDCSNMELNAIEFDGCTFNRCSFNEATFRHCRFVDCEFNHCNLSLMNVDYSSFSDVSFNDSKVIGVDWTRASWQRLVFNAPIKFKECLLNDSSFYGLVLNEILIENCKAIHVEFGEADLSAASFINTDLLHSTFSQTNISGADFSGATNYTIDIYNNNIKNAKFSRFESIGLLESLDIELVD